MVNMKETTWRPDTCRCEVTYAFDHDLPIANQSPTPVSVYPCTDHANLPLGLQKKFDHIFSQNQRKNDVLREVYMELGLVEDSTTMRRLMEQYVERWYMAGQDEDRVVHIVTKNLNQGKKNNLQRRVNDKYGAGKVVVE